MGRVSSEELAGVHVPGRHMCWMEVHSGVGSARGDTVVCGQQGTQCLFRWQTPPAPQQLVSRHI